MAKQVQLRRGTTAQLASVTGAEGEVFVDTTKDTLTVHDNYQAGGFPLLREDLNNLSDASIGIAKVSRGSAAPFSVARVNAAGSAMEIAPQNGIVDFYHAWDKSKTTFTSTNAGVQMPGMSITITPQSADSKFYIVWSYFHETGHAGGVGIKRGIGGATPTRVSTYDADVWTGGYVDSPDKNDYDPDSNSTAEQHMSYIIDAPNTTQQIVYQLHCYSGASTGSNTRTWYHNRTIGSYQYGSSRFSIWEYRGTN